MLAVSAGDNKEQQGQQQQQQSQSQQPPQETPQAQTPPAGSAPAPQIRTSVTVNAPPPNTLVNIPMDGNKYFTVVGSILELTVRDQNGAPIPNVTVAESVTPSTTTQNPDPVTVPNGTIRDLVGTGQQTSTPLAREQAGKVIVPILATTTTVTQNHRMLIMSPSSGVMAVATHQRMLTNVDSQGQLRPYVNQTTGRSMPNFTISVSPVTVTRMPMVMCPRM